jgi:hypothetical protein
VAGVVALVAMPAVTLAGCGGGGVHVARFQPAQDQAAACRTLLEELPTSVADQPRRTVTGSSYAAAWGDPAIVLRCGVPLPADFAGAPCITRNGIGWSVPPTRPTAAATRSR